MRRQDRTELTVPVQVMWTDRQGQERFTTGQSLDISEWGMRMQIQDPLPERIYVRLRADRIKLNGSASVRSCQKKGTKYLVGLEFSGGMTWKLPGDVKAGVSASR